VTLSGFTVQYYGNSSNISYSLISIFSNYNIISGNIIKGNSGYGIYIDTSEYNSVSNNVISCLHGIGLEYGMNNNISGNLIKDSAFVGISSFWHSFNNSFYRNTLTNNSIAINMGLFCINNTISLNNITNNFFGIFIHNGINCKITKNNFISNIINAKFSFSLKDIIRFGIMYKSLKNFKSGITWDGNYWNKERNYPKIISGRTGYFSLIPFFNFDNNPAQEPYDIEVL
jgi:parallel beta-helix repeat protein